MRLISGILNINQKPNYFGPICRYVNFFLPWMPFYLLFLFLNIAGPTYPNTSRTDSENNNSLKLRQLRSHLYSPKLAVSFSRDRCIYHIHKHSKMKSSTKEALAHSFSSRKATKHFEYLNRGSPASVFLRESRNLREVDGQRQDIPWYIQSSEQYKSLKTALIWLYTNW